VVVLLHGYAETSDSWTRETFDPAQRKPLPPGSFCTEPANRARLAETRDDPVIVQITGMGPSSTRYVDPATDPRGAIFR